MNQMTPIAAGIASLGRGNDKMLVHMTPGEVQGLQSLAMAHGGSLTINPQTGLPEAGFLSSILPMVAGAALAATGVGAPMAALMVGGVGALATGSLGKGLMMGLGAYGGAGLGSAFGAAGAAGVGEAAATGVGEGITAGVSENAAANMTAQQAAERAATMGPDMAGNFALPEPPALDYITPRGTQMANQAMQTGDWSALDKMAGVVNPPAPPTSFSNMGRGMSNMLGGPNAEAARNAFMQNVGGLKGLTISGGAAAAPFIMDSLQPGEMQTPPKTPTTYAKYGYNQVRNPLWGQPGQPYFTQRYSSPTFTTDPREVMGAKAGGLMNYADGGYVPESGSVRIPTVEDESNESRVPDTKIRFAGYAPEKSGSLANLSELQLKLIAARSTDPEKKGAAIRELYIRRGAQQPGSQFISAEKFMADGGVVPAPQMPTSPLFQQTPAANPAALENYLAQLGQQVMGGVTPRPQLPDMGVIIPDPAQPAQTTSDITKQYTYNPATQTFGINPNYVAPVEPVVENNNDNNNDYDSGDAAGGPIKARYAAGGLGSLPEYAAGGKLLNGPGDGVSDSIPAVIKGPRPQRAALADGEFVIPARIVSELGNGSTKAGAKRLYAMMERVQRARRKTTGKNKVAVDNKPDKLLPA